MATVPVPVTVGVGQKITASLWNGQVRDPATFLLDPPRVKVFRSVNQSLSNNAWDKINFDQEAYDSDAMHSTSTNNSRLIAVTPGLYHIDIVTPWAANATGARYIRVEKNAAGAQGAGTLLLNNYAFPALNATANAGTVSFQQRLLVNDYIEVFVLQNSGGALNLLGGTEADVNVSMRWVAQ